MVLWRRCTAPDARGECDGHGNEKEDSVTTAQAGYERIGHGEHEGGALLAGERAALKVVTSPLEHGLCVTDPASQLVAANR